MQPLKKIPHSLRKQIDLCRKKQMDIAHLINGYDISNEDLSHCLISDLNLSEHNIENVNFSGSRIKLQFQKGRARNCTFMFTTFLEGSTLRNADMRECNFTGVIAPHIDFSYADLRQCNICNMTISFFSKKFYKTKLDSNFTKLLSQFLCIEGFDI